MYPLTSLKVKCFRTQEVDINTFLPPQNLSESVTEQSIN